LVKTVALGGVSDPVRATLFIGDTTFAIAVANWSPSPVAFTLGLEWVVLEALGLPRAAHRNAQLKAHRIDGFQQRRTWELGAQLTLQGKGSGHEEGLLLELSIVEPLQSTVEQSANLKPTLQRGGGGGAKTEQQ